MASIMTSMPLLGERSPNVRMTALSLKPNLAFACVGLDEWRKSGIPCGMTSIFSCGTRYTVTQQLPAFLSHDDDP